MRYRFFSSLWSTAGRSRIRAPRRSPTSPTNGRAWVAAAITLTCLPAAVPEAHAAEPDEVRVFVQDTLETRRRLRRLEDDEGRPDSVRVGADSLAADSLGAAGEPFPATDSIMQALMALSGYRPVVYQGDTLQFSTEDRSIHLRQRAHIERAGEELSADSVVYEGNTRFITAFGKSKLVNAKGEEVDSDEGPFFYHTERRIGTVVGGRTRWEVWNVEGNFTLEGSDTLWVKTGHFTSCDLPEPHYRFESDKIKLVLGHIVVAWPVRLYFGDVPVFWFPFMAQDIRRGRHSGILTLRFGVNDIVRNSPGYNRHISNVGYYWAISDYMDAQLSLDWWSDTWTRLDGYYRYRWRQKFLDGRIGYSHFFLPDGGREISGTWNHSQKFGERADLRASVQFVSSQEFNRENEFNPERLAQNIRSNVGFSRRFDWGTLNLSGQRVQPITAGEATTTTLPQFSLTLSPIVFTPAPSPLEKRWYHGLTWTGSTNFNFQATEPAPITTTIPSDTGEVRDSVITLPDRFNINAGLSSGVSLGSLRWNSSGSYAEQIIDEPDTLIVERDSIVVLPDLLTKDTLTIGSSIRRGTLNWRSSLGYQQRLIGSTSVTPAVNLDGSLFRSNQTGLSFVSAPTRFSVSATLNSDVYGFFPGVGPLERIRHKFSPAFNWNYSPAVTPSPELDDLRGFNAAAARERHQISVTFAQTFEAKLKPRAALPPEAEGEGTAGDPPQASQDTARVQPEPGASPQDTARAAQPEQDRKLTLLAIRTSALAYDFVEKKLITEQISNSLTSDLLRGFTVRVDHDLFENGPDRRFDPFLTQLNLSFSIGERTVAGLFGEPSGGVRTGPGILPEAEGFREEEQRLLEEEQGRGPAGAESSKARRPWNLGINYTLVRQRPPLDPEAPRSPNRQTVRSNLGFSPTENWSLSWRTTYDLEAFDFIDHAISLRRDLHRWSATFEFLQAANGNFVFNFRINHNDLRDIKFDYRQESR